MARYPGLTLRVLGADSAVIGPGKAQLITLIDSTGSISAAARQLDMSYRRAWQLVEALNSSFTEAVVLTAIGGKRGGGAQVTAFGKALVTQFRAMEDKASAAIAEDLARFREHLREPAPKRK